MVYFPQGHLEQLSDFPAVAYDLPPHVFCRVVDVKLHVSVWFLSSWLNECCSFLGFNSSNSVEGFPFFGAKVVKFVSWMLWGQAEVATDEVYAQVSLAPETKVRFCLTFVYPCFGSSEIWTKFFKIVSFLFLFQQS